MRKFSKDRTRLATDEPDDVVFGIACYAGKAKDGRFEGNFAFNCGDVEAVERWLETGEEPQGKVVRYGAVGE